MTFDHLGGYRLRREVPVLPVLGECGTGPVRARPANLLGGARD